MEDSFVVLTSLLQNIMVKADYYDWLRQHRPAILHRGPLVGIRAPSSGLQRQWYCQMFHNILGLFTKIDTFTSKCAQEINLNFFFKRQTKMHNFMPSRIWISPHQSPHIIRERQTCFATLSGSAVICCQGPRINFSRMVTFYSYSKNS